MAILIREGASPAELKVADDWCIRLPEGYTYTTYRNEKDGTLLKFHNADDSEKWDVKYFESTRGNATDLLQYGFRSRVEMLLIGPRLNGDKKSELTLRQESDLCVYCQHEPHSWFGSGKRRKGAVYRVQILTLQGIYEIKVGINARGTLDEYQIMLNRILSSICLVQDKTAPEYMQHFMELNQMLPVTEPQDSSILASYLGMQENMGSYARWMLLGAVLSDSVEYMMCDFREIEAGAFSLSETAWNAAEVFRVDEDSYHSNADREVEIQFGYIREIESMQTFRTFAWMVGEYCKLKGCRAAELDRDIVLALGQLAGSRRVCYDESHFPAICGLPDLYAVYLPDGKSCSGFDKLPSDIRENADDAWRFADLYELRRELTELHPCIQIMIDYLRSTRKDTKKQLRGIHSDIVYVWCSLTVSANFAFAITPDGPMNYSLDTMDYQDFLDAGSQREYLDRDSAFVIHLGLSDQHHDEDVQSERQGHRCEL